MCYNSHMNSEVFSQTLIVLNVFMLILLVWVFVVLMIDPYVEKVNRRLMLTNAGIIMSLVITQRLEVYYELNGIVFGRLIISIYEYIMRPVVIVIFMQVVARDRKPWGLIVVNTIIFLSAFFTDVAFTITPANKFERGPLGFTSHIVSLLLLIWLIVKTMIRYRSEGEHRSRMMLIPILMVGFILISVVLDTFILPEYQVSFLMVAMVGSCVMYYTWLHLQFVREHEEDLKAQQRIKIMMSQIQPHFMYNTLSTIQALCLSDPQMASETTGKFGAFLRQNIDSLSQTELIPFEKELEHTETYAEIEMVRFPFLRIEYDTEDMDFELPALTIQPLVENAIRHGIRIRKSGVVRIKTRYENNEHIIIVQDNGKGFDVSTLSDADGSHIGIRNVRERIETMCDGTFSIESEKDEGTTVTIRIPEK